MAITTELLTPSFKGVGSIRRLIRLADTVPLYAYLYKKNADLAPRLGTTLRKIKAEGLIEQYRREAEQEVSAP